MKKNINKIFLSFIGIGMLSLLVPNNFLFADTNSTIPLCEITRNLTIGSVGEDVRCLQRYLNWSGYTVSSSGVGSLGNETTYFGPLTANAVMRWQNSHASQVLSPAGLTTGTGYWGQSSFGHYVTIVRNALGA